MHLRTRLFSGLHRLPLLGLPGALLLALLQRTPALPAAATSSAGAIIASPLGAVLRAAFTGATSLGAVHALAGATAFTVSPRSPISGTVGVPIATVVFTYVGTPAAPASWRITGSLPPGLSYVQSISSGGIINARTPQIAGTPTAGGTFTIRVQGYNNLNATGDTSNSPETITFNITGALPAAPEFTTHPASQSVTAGTAVTLAAVVSGSPQPTLQWQRDGQPILGATATTLNLGPVQPADAGDYRLVAGNPSGTATSAVATLTVSAATDATARLSNLSVRTALAANTPLIVGVVVNDGPRDILVRAAGPALAAFGLASVMADPRLELFNGAQSIFANDNWTADLAPTFAGVGAFAFAGGSRDAAFVRSLDAAYSIQARGPAGGVVLVEAYDTGAPTAARLVNVSARNRVGLGDDILIAGFAIAGTGAKRLLIRAVGPTLAGFGVTGVLADPKLEIYSAAGVKVTENDNWAASLAASFSAVGAFSLPTGSRDAALVATLAPGSYTAQVRGADGGTGEALIELYEAK